MTVDAIFRPQIRIAVVTLTAGGVILAGGTAVDAAFRLGALSAMALMGLAVALTILSIAIWKGARLARMASLVATGGQLVAILGLVWELSHGIDPGKANELLQLGVDPYLGLWANVAYSSAAVAIFLWAIVPLVIHRRLRVT